MIVLVDTNEEATNPKIVTSIRKKFSTVITTVLPCADINIPLDDGGVLAIERKTCNDFLSSIADGRIFEQVERMAQNAKYSAFIVTGYFTYGEKNDMVFVDSKQTNWKGSAVRSTIRVIQYSGCAIEFCPVSRFPDIIAELYTTVNKPDERRGIQKHRIITFPPVDDRIEFLAQLPGVQLLLAERLLNWAGMMDGVPPDEDGNTYGTLASALHWLSILSQIDKKSRPKGWGAALIFTLRKFLGLNSNQYIKVQEEQ